MRKSPALGVPTPKLDVSARDRPLLRHGWKPKVSAADQEFTAHVVPESLLHRHPVSAGLVSGFVKDI